jgi:hypothetical protein
VAPFWISTDSTRVVLDYAALLSLLRSFAHGLDNVSEKGTRFEAYVRRVVGEIPGATPLWFSKKLRHPDGTSREIDASFLKGEALFICELKCVGLSWAFSEGTREALDFRRGKCEDGLRQVDSKASWLAEHTSGLNYELPQGTTAIVPLLVSPFVEYIWSREPNLWLSDEVPRICTPGELRKVTPETLGGKPFVVRVV